MNAPDPRRYAPESLTDRIVNAVDDPPPALTIALVVLVLIELSAFVRALCLGDAR